jgi:hypothetical protein
MLDLKKILKGLPKEPYIATDGYIPPRPPRIIFPTEPSPFGDPKNVEVAEQTLTLKQGNLWYPEAAQQPLEINNICLWYDGTLRPGRGHSNCKWTFDGQIWRHL